VNDSTIIISGSFDDLRAEQMRFLHKATAASAVCSSGGRKRTCPDVKARTSAKGNAR
jgi:hypothetical protein